MVDKICGVFIEKATPALRQMFAGNG